jgi:hypothetical protein
MALANKAKRLTDVGVEAPAHIDSMTSTARPTRRGGTEHVIALTVKPASAEAYQATVNQYVYPSNPFSEGQDVKVRVRPGGPDLGDDLGRRLARSAGGGLLPGSSSRAQELMQ